MIGFPGTRVPERYIESGKIILNVSERAVSNYHQDNDWILFQARFGGHSQEIVIPVAAVLAIYAKENGKGMVFGQEDSVGGEVPPPEPPAGAPKPGKPRLQVVK